MFSSWFLERIANREAATKFKTVWFMAALLEPQLTGWAYLLYKQGILSCWELVMQEDLITFEVSWQSLQQQLAPSAKPLVFVGAALYIPLQLISLWLLWVLQTNQKHITVSHI